MAAERLADSDLDELRAVRLRAAVAERQRSEAERAAIMAEGACEHVYQRIYGAYGLAAGDTVADDGAISRAGR